MSTVEDAITDREAAVIEADLHILSREPAFRSIVRLFQSRKAEGRDPVLLQKRFFESLWLIVKRDANLP